MKHTVRTPPARYIEMETQKNTDFILHCVSQFPRVSIGEIQVTPETGDLLWIDVDVTNEKTYPTSSDRENELGSAIKDQLFFRSSNNIALVEIPDATTVFDPTNPTSEATAASGETTEFRLKGKETKTFRYLVQRSSGSGWIEFEVDSFHAGSATKRIEIRADN